MEETLATTGEFTCFTGELTCLTGELTCVKGVTLPECSLDFP